MPTLDPKSQRGKTGDLLRLFLFFGLTAFGGPAAHLVSMQRECVERRKWVSRERFLDLVGACNLLPGPGSTQVAMALGYSRAGWLGLLVAGICFILPASLATLGLAWAYVHFGNLAQMQGLLYGAKPVMVAIVGQAIWNLGRTAFRSRLLALAGMACFAAALAGVAPIVVLLASGGLVLLSARFRSRQAAVQGFVSLSLGLGGASAGGSSLASIFLVFLKLGVVVFGSGYVLLAFLKDDLVDRLHWVTLPQLLDAVTAGQVTPGPVFATATFLGFLVRGWAGAVLATVAIFLPSFFMAAAVGALAARIRSSPMAGAFLDGVNVAAVALMGWVALVLGRASLVDFWTTGMSLVSVVLLIRFRLNATWLILGGAALGILLKAIGA
jgi:chromate transporter